MKKLFSTFIKAITMLSFIFSANLAFANKKVTIVVEHWAPWEIAHDDNKANITDGLAIDILNELFSRLELDIEYKNTPWQRALKQIETGEIDLIPMVLKTPEREEYMTFTTPIYNDPILFAYSTDKHDALEWNSWEDLKSLKIGMTRGYTYGGLNDAIKEGELDATVSTNDTQSIKKLLSGRFDIVPLLLFIAERNDL
jgi:polar amino acid transport system substrate-binding protein